MTEPVKVTIQETCQLDLCLSHLQVSQVSEGDMMKQLSFNQAPLQLHREKRKTFGR